MRKQMIALAAAALLGLGVAGCGGSGSDATPTPTPTVTETPKTEVTETPKGPSPEEIEYYNLKQKAKDLVYSRDYEKAKPVLAEALEKKPDDVYIYFLLMLTHGNEETEPSTDSEAFKMAAKVVEMSPKSKEAEKARSYIASAHAEPLSARQSVGNNTLEGKFWKIEKGAAYDVQAEVRLYTGGNQNLTRPDERRLWEMEVYPEGEEDFIVLPVGSKMVIAKKERYLWSKTAWRGPIPKQPQKYDNNIYNIAAFYVQVVDPGGDLDGKTGWMINQMDRWITDDWEAEQPWGVWVDNRLRVPLE